jgi:uncharacterized protein (TIRG00374 family)
MQSTPIPRRGIILSITVVVALIAAVLLLSDRQELASVLENADWRAIPGALGLTILSYLCVGYSFALVCNTIGIRMSRRDLSEIGYVTTVLNHVITSGGVVGYSVRYFLMSEQEVPLKDVLAASTLHFYLTSLDMISMLPVGILIVMLNTQVSQPVMTGLTAMTVLLTLVALIATLFIFVDSLRTALLETTGKIVLKVIRKDVRPSLEKFEEALGRGARIIRQNPSTLIAVMLLTFVDWFCSVLVLWFCFTALGPAVELGKVISGFVIGVMAGVVSMVPGGLGVQEGSMAGIFALLGSPLHQAVLASILFRVVYYILPYFVSLAFYGRLLQRSRRR